jgi:prepilin-type N-terminal cleavage/methylation domain-containing protein
MRRVGFTLVELLIALAIIALLMSLVLLGLGTARRRTQLAAVTCEIDQLAAALHAYKDARGAFPPSFAGYSAGTGTAHKALIMRHLANAFPQYTGDTDGDGDHDYDDWHDDIHAGTSDFDPVKHPGGLHVSRLDQAEAIVLWLGGLPSIRTETKLIGFSRNPLNPFESDTVQTQRTATLFAFKPERLVDRDEDGWWEYVPNLDSPTGEMSPYVYFDSATYTAWTAPTPSVLVASYPSANPRRGGRDTAHANQRIQEWGRCWPLWRVERNPLPPSPLGAGGTPAQWVNQDSFQILCAGEDAAYSLTSPAPIDPATFPHLDEPTDPDDPILDNLANFAEGTFEDVHAQHGDEH